MHRIREDSIERSECRCQTKQTRLGLYQIHGIIQTRRQTRTERLPQRRKTRKKISCSQRTERGPGLPSCRVSREVLDSRIEKLDKRLKRVAAQMEDASRHHALESKGKIFQVQMHGRHRQGSSIRKKLCLLKVGGKSMDILIRKKKSKKPIDSNGAKWTSPIEA